MCYFALNRGDFKTTVQLIEYCVTETHLAQRYPGNIDEIMKFEEDVELLRVSCESIKLRNQADSMLESSVFGSETVLFETLWDVLDKYKAAELACREKDVENEALAVYHQASLFDKMFKIHDKAKRYYRTAFDLALSLQPKDLSNCGWFKETKLRLEHYQKLVLEEERKQKESDKAPYLEKMKETLKGLKAASEKYGHQDDKPCSYSLIGKPILM
jgi:hypothetical protein